MTLESRAARGGVNAWGYRARVAGIINRYGEQVAEFARNHSPSDLAELDRNTLPYPLMAMVRDLEAAIREAIAVPEPGQEDYDDMIAELDEIFEGPASFVEDEDDFDESVMENLVQWADWWDVLFDFGSVRDTHGD